MIQKVFSGGKYLEEYWWNIWAVFLERIRGDHWGNIWAVFLEEFEGVTGETFVGYFEKDFGEKYRPLYFIC